MKIYVCRPMKGCGYEEVAKYYNEIGDILKDIGYTFLNPMCGKSYLKDELEFKSSGYKQNLSTDHSIYSRDKWMVRICDICFVNLLGAEQVSIGSVAELVLANELGKHTVLVMEKGNPHWHAFVLEAADVLFEHLEDALDYFSKLSKGEI